MDRRPLRILAWLALCSMALAEPAPPGEGEPLPAESKSIKDVLLPVPREIFETLDRFRDSNWRRVQRSDIAALRPRIDPTENALLLGVVISEGFIAAAAKDAAEVKSLGGAVLRFARALGVEQAALRRSRSIVEHAENGDWPAVRKEWDGVLPDVQGGMKELQSEQLAQLVSAGGWLRGGAAVTALVLQNYATTDAELLRQPALLDYFDQRLAEMSGEIRANPNVVRMRASIPKIRQLMMADEARISKETGKKIWTIADSLIKDLGRRNRG
ncbi:MAG: hypothetical protein ABIR71_03230 [Chthoniobacterales bacterium]